MGLVEWL